MLNKVAVWLVTAILLLYFTFTSGSVYEATGSEVTESFIVPYSAALSGERAGLIGVFTDDDIKCAEWLAYESDQSVPIIGDGNTWLLVKGYVTQPNRLTLYPPSLDVTNEPIFNAYGDSITSGSSASTSESTYASLVSSTTEMEANNLGIQSLGISDMFNTIYTSTIMPSTMSIMLVGYNDTRFFGNDQDALVSFEHCLNSYLVKLAIPTSEFRYAQDPSITYSGFWGNTDTGWGNGRVKYTDAAKSTATFSATGSIIYIDILQATGNTLGLKVTIDGKDRGTFNGSTFKSTALGKKAGKWFAPYLLRFAGLENTTHRVVLETVPSTKDNWGHIWINWIASTDGNLRSGPYTYVGNCLSPNNDSAAALYNTAIANCVKTLSEDGLRVTLVDVAANMNLATDFSGGYPNDSGHRNIANAFLAKITDEAIANTCTANNQGELYYIFLRTWNIGHQKLVFGGSSAGMREIKDLSQWKLDLYKEAFRSGKAVVYERR